MWASSIGADTLELSLGEGQIQIRSDLSFEDYSHLVDKTVTSFQGKLEGSVTPPPPPKWLGVKLKSIRFYM